MKKPKCDDCRHKVYVTNYEGFPGRNVNRCEKHNRPAIHPCEDFVSNEQKQIPLIQFTTLDATTYQISVDFRGMSPDISTYAFYVDGRRLEPGEKLHTLATEFLQQVADRVLDVFLHGDET